MDRTTDKGRSHTSAYLPRFQECKKTGNLIFCAGMQAGFGASRNNQTNYEALWRNTEKKQYNQTLGPWRVGSHMMGETIPEKRQTR